MPQIVVGIALVAAHVGAVVAAHAGLFIALAAAPGTQMVFSGTCLRLTRGEHEPRSHRNGLSPGSRRL
jgi:hypothetical protein